MNFGEALIECKYGSKIYRDGWNGKGMFVVYQKGYPDGIPCNAQTAEAWGLQEGDLFKCEPYLQIKMSNGSHAMWVPSINDVLSTDWVVDGLVESTPRMYRPSKGKMAVVVNCEDGSDCNKCPLYVDETCITMILHRPKYKI